MAEQPSRKVVRSYRLVFRRRWRIFRIQNWRIPLPGGLELRCRLLARLPGGSPCSPACRCSAGDRRRCRLAAPPGAADRRGLGALALGGRRALAPPGAGRPRLGGCGRASLAALRRCPAPGSDLAPLRRLVLAPDLVRRQLPARAPPAAPPGCLLRYPVAVALEGVPRGAGGSPRAAAGGARRWRLRPTGGPPLHRGKTLEVPAGRTVVFEAEGAVRAPHYFFWANLVLRTPTDAWAVYELEGQSYPGLSERARSRWGSAWRRSPTPRADFQILRVARSFDAAAYVRRALTTLDPRHGQRERFERHIAEHRSEFERRGRCAPRSTSPSASASPSGGGPLGGLLDGVARALGGTLAERLGFEEARGIGPAQLAALRHGRGGRLRAGARLPRVRAGRAAAARRADPPRLHPRPRRARH